MAGRFGSTRRPPRALLEGLIRETGGNVTRLSTRLGVTRQTCYAWIYQLDLTGVVGIRTREQQQEDMVPDERLEGRPEPESTPRKGRPPGPERIAISARVDPRVWRAVRIRAIDEDRSASEILEAAARAYLERVGVAVGGGPTGR